MTYEFSCNECKNVFEEYQSITQETEHTAKCPQCGKTGRRKFHAANFREDFHYGWDAGAGKGFDSARQRDNYLAEKGLVKHKSN